MIGNAQWVTTRDASSVAYFLEEIEMQRQLKRDRAVYWSRLRWSWIYGIAHMLRVAFGRTL